MHERRNRGGAFHGIGQPYVQRELSALADAAAENAQAGDYQEPVTIFLPRQISICFAVGSTPRAISPDAAWRTMPSAC